MFEYDLTLKQTYKKVGEGWFPNQHGQEIVAASFNGTQFLLALSGGKLVLLTSLGKELQEMT